MSIMGHLETISALLVDLAARSTPDRRADANAVAITIGRHLDVLLNEVRMETAASVMTAARALAEADVRVEVAQAAGAESFTALCDAVASAPVEALGRIH